jgi:mannose-6-phosphate isomerase-like protein (cupin superfamily)
MWRKQNSREEVVDVYSGVAVTIPKGTEFQGRSFEYEPLAAIIDTMPPWPGSDDAVYTKGPWSATVDH